MLPTLLFERLNCIEVSPFPVLQSSCYVHSHQVKPLNWYVTRHGYMFRNVDKKPFYRKIIIWRVIGIGVNPKQCTFASRGKLNAWLLVSDPFDFISRLFHLEIMTSISSSSQCNFPGLSVCHLFWIACVVLLTEAFCFPCFNTAFFFTAIVIPFPEFCWIGNNET
jgi:hypothetical protein